MQHSVYWIHHPEHTDMFTQGYIGVSKFAEKRWEQHNKRTENRHLRFAIDKHGWDTLVKEVVLISSKAYCLMIELKLRAEDAVGWNIVKGGGYTPKSKKGVNLGKDTWNKGLAYSDETKAKISNNVKILWENPEYRQHMVAVHQGQIGPMTGKKHTAETIENLKLIKLGKPSGKKGMKMPQEYIEKMKQLAIKESWICPHCNKQGKAKGAGNRWHFDNCKEKGINHDNT